MTAPHIIYQCEEFLVINKPAGMIVNNADTSRDEFTVQDWASKNLKFKIENLKLNEESEFEKRGGIVHRLDKETSGALIIALTVDAFVNIQSQFKKREVEKVYLALCHGKMVAEGEINVPIGRLPWNRMRFGVLPQGRDSYTKFKTLKHYILAIGREKEQLSLVEVYPKTGRTHQIRVHFQYAGHPIFADSLYGGRKTFARDKKFLNRHFLHASKITFTNPITQKKQTFEAPLVSELSSFLDFIA
jgi:23S rRNA pseudouridine1911/1915/1917 synthase